MGPRARGSAPGPGCCDALRADKRMSGRMKIHAGQLLFAGERNTAVDDQPTGAAVRRRTHRSRDSSRSRQCRQAARTRARGRDEIRLAPAARDRCGGPVGSRETLRRQQSFAPSRRRPAATIGRARRDPRCDRDISRSRSFTRMSSPIPSATRGPIGADIGKSRRRGAIAAVVPAWSRIMSRTKTPPPRWRRRLSRSGHGEPLAAG